MKNLLKMPQTRYPATTIIRWLWTAWRGNHLQAILNAVTGLAEVALSLLQVWAVKHAIDVASGASEGSIYMAVGFMAIIIVCDFALSIGSVWIRNILGIRAQNRMQQRILDRLLRSEWNGRERRHSGDVLNRLEGDVNTVVNFLAETIPNTLSVLALFLGAFFYLFSMDHVLAFIVVAIIPVFAVLSKVYVRRMRKLTRMVRDSDSRVQSTLQETLQHRILVKSLESEKAMVGKLEETQSELRHNVIRRTRFSVFSNLMLNTGFSCGYLVAFLWAAVRMSEHTLTFGGMTAFLQLVNKIQSPARSLTRLVPAFVNVLTAAERLMELEDSPLEEQGASIIVPPPCGIRLNDVAYRYPDGTHNVLSHLSFDFKPGTCTAILGETGAGKTTLIRLLLALLRPTEGKLEIYNSRTISFSDIETPDQEHLETWPLSPRMRCNLTYVPQGNTLMSGTIRENLRLGRPYATDGEMREALRKSCAEFVFDLPQGLDTSCAEQGGGLSEGQAQRIAIARALLRNAPIMLLDEATSALDADTERRLLANLLADKTHTVVFITHRTMVTTYCDQTLRIERKTD